jgi:hypothetical protein
MKKFIFVLSLGFCLFVSGCELFQKGTPDKPLLPVYQYFDEEDGALARYISLLEEKLEKGEISRAQFDIYMSEIEAVRGLVDEIKTSENPE